MKTRFYPLLKIGPYSDKLSYELSNIFRKYFRNIDFKIIMTNPFKISSLFSSKISFQSMCGHLWYINLVVYSVNQSMWVPPRTPSTAELLSIVAQVSALTDYWPRLPIAIFVITHLIVILP